MTITHYFKKWDVDADVEVACSSISVKRVSIDPKKVDCPHCLRVIDELFKLHETKEHEQETKDSLRRPGHDAQES